MYILNRPIEIMILVGLNAAVGAILFLNGQSTGGLELPSKLLPAPGSSLPSIIGTVMTIVGAFEIPAAIAFFGSAAALFLGKGWGWSISRTLQVAGIAMSFAFLYDAGGEMLTMGLYAMGMAMSGIVIGFLYAPEVREFYGKNVVTRSRSKRQRRRKQMESEEDQEPSAAEVE